MTYAFNADEILAIAEQIEKNGAAFYVKAATQFSDPEFKKILKELAEMEVQHQQTFSAMRGNLKDQEREQTVFDPQDDAALYLKAVADGNVFDLKATPDSFLTGEESFSEVLHYAIAREKDSIVFYVGLVDLVPQKLGQDHVHHIIKEEMSHITLLSGLLNKYRS